MPAFSKTPRIEVVDALRGFAVMAILLVHHLEHFIFPVYPDPADMPQWLNILDAGVLSVTFSLFAGKAYAIFALLFGFTFYVQYHNQQIKGHDFGVRFLWRLLLLAGFAALNAAFFPGGDVLLLFSIVGIFLFLVRKWSSKAALITALFFLLQPVEWYHYIASLFHPDYSLPNLGVGGMYNTIAETTKSGNFWKFITCNVTLGQKASLFWAVGAGRFTQTIGLFMLGLWFGRKQLFAESETATGFWVKILIVSAILYAPLYQLKAELTTGQTEIVKQTAGVALDMWQKLAFTLVLVSSFVLLYRKETFKKLTGNLRFYGKMSMTNYITQSMGGAIIYFPFAFYLAPYCGYTISLMIGILFFLFQIWCCKWWLKSHKYGPFEGLWHKLTWLKFRVNQ